LRDLDANEIGVVLGLDSSDPDNQARSVVPLTQLPSPQLTFADERECQILDSLFPMEEPWNSFTPTQDNSLSNDPQDHCSVSCSNFPCHDTSFSDTLLHSSSTDNTISTQSSVETEISAQFSDIDRSVSNMSSDISSIGEILKDEDLIKKYGVVFGQEYASKGHGDDDYTATSYYRRRTKDLKPAYQNASKHDKILLVNRFYQELDRRGFICVLEGQRLPKDKALERMKQAMRNKDPTKRKAVSSGNPKQKVTRKGEKRQKEH